MNSTDALDEYFYDTVNHERDWTAPDRHHPSQYGNYFVKVGLKWVSDYKNFGIEKSYYHEDASTYMQAKKKSSKFSMVYDVWEPKEYKGQLVTLVTTNGVPVNRTEWYDVARSLGRFVRIITIDLFGMGDSSKPVDFTDSNGNSLWSWTLHAKIFKAMFDDWRLSKVSKSWFINQKIFFAANDWGAGALQKFIELFGSEYLLGAVINSAIALNGYWVQHIGSLRALKLLPYPSPTFTAEAVRFAGTLTMLLETMFDQTRDNHNQYTMAKLQHPYVEISYSNPNKNPDNTIYKEHAIRVLAEQASLILGNGELLPWHRTKNPNGMHISNWNVPILMQWGANDKMMPVGQVHDFGEMIDKINLFRKYHNLNSNLTFRPQIIANAGHFAISDQPLNSALGILYWIRDIVTSKYIASAFVGFDELARQDEYWRISRYTELTKILETGQV